MKRKVAFVIMAAAMLSLMSCGNNTTQDETGGNEADPQENKTLDPMLDKGVGPIETLVLPSTIDDELANKGSEIFVAKCTACHKPDKKYIGPAPLGVLERRTPEWVMNMILNPDKMIVENEAAKQLLMEYNGSPMANQNLTEDEARAILEYFRTLK
jgi:mono/diheme cytochrome c family protein